jgi:hypothetical protein
MSKVEGLMDKALIGRFMGNISRGIFEFMDGRGLDIGP